MPVVLPLMMYSLNWFKSSRRRPTHCQMRFSWFRSAIPLPLLWPVAQALNPVHA